MPTGVALQDAREQLFSAAERVLLRNGPDALTSRAVTTEAGCAKGVLHRHFADFDTFLADLVADRIARLEVQAVGLREAAGTVPVTDSLTEALIAVFDPVSVAIVGLVSARHELLARLRRATPTGIPVLTEASGMFASYLRVEQDLGRIAVDADVDALALALVGTGHLLFAGRGDTAPEPEAVHRAVTTVIAAASPGH